MKIGRRVIPNTLVAFVVLALIGGGYLATNQKGDTATSPTSPATAAAEPTAKDEAAGGASSKPATSNPSTPTSTTTPAPAETLHPVFTALDQDETSIIATSTTPDAAASGTCTLVLSKSGQSPVTQTAPLEIVTSYYACRVTVAKSSLSAGTWTGVVKVAAGGKTGTSSSKQITVN